MLSIVKFFRTLSFSRKKDESNSIDSTIFSKLNLDVETSPIKHETRLDEIRDGLLYYLFKKTGDWNSVCNIGHYHNFHKS